MITVEFAAIVGIASAGCGLIGWFGRGMWIAGGKYVELDTHGREISAINDKISANESKYELQRKQILSEVKGSVCDGVQLAIKSLELKYTEKQSITDQNVAVTCKRVDAIEKDIMNIFDRIYSLEKKE